MFLPEGDVEAEAEVGPGVVDGNELFGVFRGEVVGTDEEIEARGTDVEDSAYRTAHVGYRPVDREVQGREGTEVDGGHTLGIGAISDETGGGEETERDSIVEHGILGTHAQGGAQRVAHRLLVGHVELGEGLEVFAQLVGLFLEGVVAVLVVLGTDVVEARELELFRGVGLGAGEVVPAHEADIGECSREGEVVDEFVGGTQVESQTEAGQTEVVPQFVR